jgi:hypothetical protein
VVGVLPAFRASRVRVIDLPHDGGRGGSPGRQRVRSVLVVLQVAASLTLLVVAGLFVRSLQRAQRIDLGFDANQVLSVRLNTLQAGFDGARTKTFYDELDRRLRAIPGVESVSQSFTVPLGYVLGSVVARPEGSSPDDWRGEIGTNSVSPAYFDTLRIPVLRGRGFHAGDDAGGTRVAIVNQTLAARFWPNEDPIGRRIEVPSLGAPPWQVVGVARDGKYLAVFEDSLPHVYLPLAQDPSHLRAVLVRSALPPDQVRSFVRQEIAQLAPEMPISEMGSLREALNGNIGIVLFRVGVWQGSAMGLLGATRVDPISVLRHE